MNYIKNIKKKILKNIKNILIKYIKKNIKVNIHQINIQILVKILFWNGQKMRNIFQKKIRKLWKMII